MCTVGWLGSIVKGGSVGEGGLKESKGKNVRGDMRALVGMYTI